MEQLITKIGLPDINNIRIIEHIVVNGFNKTGAKFSVEFNGSKGYLNHITISCEGSQTADNTICFDKWTTKQGALRKKVVSIYHSQEHGVRIEL